MKRRRSILFSYYKKYWIKDQPDQVPETQLLLDEEVEAEDV